MTKPRNSWLHHPVTEESSASHIHKATCQTTTVNKEYICYYELQNYDIWCTYVSLLHLRRYQDTTQEKLNKYAKNTKTRRAFLFTVLLSRSHSWKCFGLRDASRLLTVPTAGRSNLLIICSGRKFLCIYILQLPHIKGYFYSEQTYSRSLVHCFTEVKINT